MINRRLLFLTIILAVLGWATWNLFRPALETVFQLRQDLAQQQKKFEEVKDLKEKLNTSWKQKYEALQNDISKIMAALPGQEDIPALLVQFEALASQNGLILNSIKFTPSPGGKKAAAAVFSEPDNLKQPNSLSLPTAAAFPDETAAPSSLSVSLDLSGNFFALKNFLKAAENSLRLTDITSVAFGQTSGAAGSLDKAVFSLTSINIGLNVYHK